MTVRTSLIAASIAIVGVSSFAPNTHPSFSRNSHIMASTMERTQATTTTTTTTPYFLSEAEIPVVEEKVVEEKVVKKAPVARKAPAKKKKGANPAHKEGIFSPIVVVAKQVLGEKRLNQVRGKFISTHSDVIKGFVATSDSPFGQKALSELFKAADIDGDGKLTKEEVAIALRSLGFSWLKEKQIDGIIARADSDENGLIDYEEFAEEAPRTLKTNLVKLAKKNGGDMGWLV